MSVPTTSVSNALAIRSKSKQKTDFQNNTLLDAAVNLNAEEYLEMLRMHLHNKHFLEQYATGSQNPQILVTPKSKEDAGDGDAIGFFLSQWHCDSGTVAPYTTYSKGIPVTCVYEVKSWENYTLLYNGNQYISDVTLTTDTLGNVQFHAKEPRSLFSLGDSFLQGRENVGIGNSSAFQYPGMAVMAALATVAITTAAVVLPSSIKKTIKEAPGKVLNWMFSSCRSHRQAPESSSAAQPQLSAIKPK